MRNSVDLPAPFGPNREVTPGPTVKLTSETATTSPKDLVTFGRQRSASPSPDLVEAVGPVAVPEKTRKHSSGRLKLPVFESHNAGSRDEPSWQCLKPRLRYQSPTAVARRLSTHRGFASPFHPQWPKDRETRMRLRIQPHLREMSLTIAPPRVTRITATLAKALRSVTLEPAIATAAITAEITKLPAANCKKTSSHTTNPGDRRLSPCTPKERAAPARM